MVSITIIFIIFIVFILVASIKNVFTRIFGYIGSIISGIIIVYLVYNYTNPLKDIPSQVDVLSGFVDTGTNNSGKIIIDTPISDIDKYSNLIKSGNYKTINFPIQNTKSAGNYDGNTTLLRDYMMNSIKSIHIPHDITGGYLYIKLRKPLADNRSVVLRSNIYINQYQIYGGMKLSSTLPVYNDNEYLFDLKNVPIINVQGKNRFSNIKGKTINLGGYVGSFDGNGIESITIARY